MTILVGMVTRMRIYQPDESSTGAAPVPGRRRAYVRLAIEFCLLVAGLGAINFAVARMLPASWDLTHQGSFTLAPQTTKVLATITAPVEVTLLASRDARTTGDRAFQQTAAMCRELLELYRHACPALVVRELDPAENAEARQLQQMFPDVTVPSLVMRYGTGTDLRHEVLRQRDLVEMRNVEGSHVPAVDFLGEQALTAALSRLVSGRRQTIVYVLTGHGELALDDAAPNSSRGMGTLRQHLKQVDCELRPLDLRHIPHIPKDADLLLLAGPEQPLSEAETSRLRSFLLHGGRALCLFDFVYDPLTKSVPDTGLEALLAEYGVLLGKDRVITHGFTGQVDIASPAIPSGADHPLVRSLPTSALTLLECRSVRMLMSPDGSSQRATPVLLSYDAPRAWSESDSQPGHAPQPGGDGDIAGPIAMALAVERSTEVPSVPVCVVVGDAEFASNKALTGSQGRQGYSFLVASVNWLRGRKLLLGDIPPRHHEPYRLAGDASVHRGLVWKSTLVLVAFLITAGATVWTTRHAR